MKISERILVGALILLVAFLLISPLAKSISNSLQNSTDRIANPTNH